MTKIRQVEYKGNVIEYELQFKNVKNINLRVRKDGSVMVSSNRRPSLAYLDNFVVQNGELILKARLNQKIEKCKYDSDLELRNDKKLLKITKTYFENRVKYMYDQCNCKDLDIPMPQVKTRFMKSRWGSCRLNQKSITLNLRLCNYPEDALDYVIVHELAHFVQCNHSKAFYNVVASMMPDYKNKEKILKKGAI